jgi:hypothetical protein
VLSTAALCAPAPTAISKRKIELRRAFIAINYN